MINETEGDSERKKSEAYAYAEKRRGGFGEEEKGIRERGGYIGCRKETKKGHVSVPHEWRFLNQRHPERQLQLSCHVVTSAGGGGAAWWRDLHMRHQQARDSLSCRVPSMSGCSM